MAVLTIAKDNDSLGKTRIYATEEDVRILVDYTLRKSKYTIYGNLQPFHPVSESISNQILFIQRCRSKKITNRMVHLIIGFDTLGYEDKVDIPMICSIMDWMNREYFQECQRVLCLHTDKTNHLHLHFIVNPVKLNDYHLARYNLQALMKDMAFWLDGVYQVALQGASYYDVEAKLHSGKEDGAFLYQNEYCRRNGLCKQAFL